MEHRDVVGIGNAIVDIIGRCDDAFLAHHGCRKGAMQLVDAETVKRLYDAIENGVADLSDPILKGRIGELKATRDQARLDAERAEEAIDRWTELMVKGSVGIMPIPWTDWLECKLYHREAKILLTGVAPPEDPRLRKVRDRALARSLSGNQSQTDRRARESTL